MACIPLETKAAVNTSCLQLLLSDRAMGKQLKVELDTRSVIPDLPCFIHAERTCALPSGQCNAPLQPCWWPPFLSGLAQIPEDSWRVPNNPHLMSSGQWCSQLIMSLKVLPPYRSDFMRMSYKSQESTMPVTFLEHGCKQEPTKWRAT